MGDYTDREFNEIAACDNEREDAKKKRIREVKELLDAGKLRPAQEHAVDVLLAKHTREPWAKRCGCCGRTHDLASWLALPERGHQADAVEDLELRDCPCGSTLAVLLLPSGQRLA
jgi:hypothetical protein